MMFNTVRVAIVYGFWLILGFVMFYEYLEAYFLSLRKNKIETVKPVIVKPIKVVEVAKPIVKPIVVKPFDVKVEKPVVIEKPVVQEVIKPVIVQKPIVKETPKPVVVESDDDEDEEAMTQVSFFSNDLVENPNFYKSLKAKAKTDFDNLFVLDTPKHMVKELQYVVGQNNGRFFTDVFKYIYKYRRVISVELLNILLKELLTLTKDPASQSLLYEAYIRVAYARRQQPEFLEEAKRVCLLDIALHKDVLKTKDAYVYSFVRLAIIYENQKKYKDALEIIDSAIERGLDDRTVSRFGGRRARIVEKRKI